MKPPVGLHSGELDYLVLCTLEVQMRVKYRGLLAVMAPNQICSTSAMPQAPPPTNCPFNKAFWRAQFDLSLENDEEGVFQEADRLVVKPGARTKAVINPSSENLSSKRSSRSGSLGL